MKDEAQFRWRMLLAGLVFLLMVVALRQFEGDEGAKALVILVSLVLVVLIAPIRIVLAQFRQILSPNRRARIGASKDERDP